MSAFEANPFGSDISEMQFGCQPDKHVVWEVELVYGKADKKQIQMKPHVTWKETSARQQTRGIETTHVSKYALSMEDKMAAGAFGRARNYR